MKRTPKPRERAPLAGSSTREIAIAAVEATIGIAAFRGYTRAALRRELRRKREWFLSFCSDSRGTVQRAVTESALSAVWYRALRHVAGMGVRELTRSEQLAFAFSGEPEQRAQGAS